MKKNEAYIIKLKALALILLGMPLQQPGPALSNSALLVFNLAPPHSFQLMTIYFYDLYDTGLRHIVTRRFYAHDFSRLHLEDGRESSIRSSLLSFTLHLWL